jgi:large subunit ribosomal protein L24
VKKRFQSKFNIRKGDSVVVITGAGKDRTTPKRVLAVHTDTDRILVEGVNTVTKHKKPSAQNPQGGIIQEEAPIHISNVMLWDAKTKSGTRIKRERTEKGFNRVAKKSGEAIK